MIVETCVSLRQKNGNLKPLCPGGRVLEVLTVLRLLEVIESFDEESQALGSFGLRVIRRRAETRPWHEQVSVFPDADHPESID